MFFVFIYVVERACRSNARRNPLEPGTRQLQSFDFNTSTVVASAVDTRIMRSGHLFILVQGGYFLFVKFNCSELPPNSLADCRHRATVTKKNAPLLLTSRHSVHVISLPTFCSQKPCSPLALHCAYIPVISLERELRNS